jgi:alpha-L-fucosidase 2
MKTTRRRFIQNSLAATAAGYLHGSAAASDQSYNLRADEIAKRHRIARDVPGPNFFEGMLLGNGDVGVCAVVHPDALGLYISKSDCWDIRVSEDIEKNVLTFQELLKLWARAGEAAKRQGKPDMLYLETNIDFFREYTEKVASSYRMPWPRPWPCGTVWIHWDPRWVHAVRQTLDPSNGLFTLTLSITDVNRQPRTASISSFVDWDSGLVSVSSEGPVPITSVCYYPEVDRESVTLNSTGNEKIVLSTLPPPLIDGKLKTGFAEFSCFQYFPAIGPTREVPNPPRSDKDRNLSLCGRLQGRWTIEGLAESIEQLKKLESGAKSDAKHYDHRPRVFFTGRGSQTFRMDLKVVTPRDILLERLERAATLTHEQDSWIIINQDHAYSREDLDTASYAPKEIERLSALPVEKLRQNSQSRWSEFWSRSAVELDDTELERIWYHNQYFLACCLRPRKTAPGLFGNWSTGRIGTAWHSDYHMDYNTQQVFWGVFSSNHSDQHLPYVELCQNLMPMSERYAREKFNLPGAYFPHSAYPAPSQMVPYPVPPWGYQISETPWTVQSLWWHYLYTQDVDYLEKTYPLLRAAARFVAAYVKKEGDGKYHVIPTVSSENWGFTVDFRLNKDCILDLALAAFLLDAVMEASTILETDATERAHWKEIRNNLAPYPKARGPYGEVWLDVENAPVEYIYNVPITMAPVFPAEQVGIGRGEEHLDVARRTAKLLRLEGGNDLVFQPLIRARLGILDLKWFKKQVRYCLLPNGAANDRVRQVGGRYRDSTDFDFMMHMGIWTENLALPAVINECLMQSYTGTIRLFPNPRNLGPARFTNLRAVGAFLVSAAFDGEKVSQVSIVSEKGKTVRLANPWKGAPVRITRTRDDKNIPVRTENGVLTFPTDAGETYRVTRS